MDTKANRKDFKTKDERLARDIIDYLLKKGIMDDTFIYVNNKRYGTRGDGEYHYGTNSWDDVYVEEDMNPKRYTEYAGDHLTITTEGFLYDALNYGYEWGSKIPDELLEIFDKYGYYYEMGHAWDLTAVEK